MSLLSSQTSTNVRLYLVPQTVHCASHHGTLSSQIYFHVLREPKLYSSQDFRPMVSLFKFERKITVLIAVLIPSMLMLMA